MNSPIYQVGQILFVILNKRAQVYPMMVVEEVTKRTLQGEVINYVLQGGSDPKTTVLLDLVDGEIFESANEAKHVLISRATTQIERLIDNATIKATEWYSLDDQDTNNQSRIMELSPIKVADNVSDNIVKVELSDGTFANLKIS